MIVLLLIFAFFLSFYFRLSSPTTVQRLQGPLQARTNKGVTVASAVPGRRVRIYAGQRIEHDCNHLPGRDSCARF